MTSLIQKDKTNKILYLHQVHREPFDFLAKSDSGSSIFVMIHIKTDHTNTFCRFDQDSKHNKEQLYALTASNTSISYNYTACKPRLLQPAPYACKSN